MSRMLTFTSRTHVFISRTAIDCLDVLLHMNCWLRTNIRDSLTASCCNIFDWPLTIGSTASVLDGSSPRDRAELLAIEVNLKTIPQSKEKLWNPPDGSLIEKERMSSLFSRMTYCLLIARLHDLLCLNIQSKDLLGIDLFSRKWLTNS